MINIVRLQSLLYARCCILIVRIHSQNVHVYASLMAICHVIVINYGVYIINSRSLLIIYYYEQNKQHGKFAKLGS